MTLEEVRAVLSELSRVGETALGKELLKNSGDKLSAVGPAEYPVLLKEGVNMYEFNYDIRKCRIRYSSCSC